jgi:hypothetical protein
MFLAALPAPPSPTKIYSKKVSFVLIVSFILFAANQKVYVCPKWAKNLVKGRINHLDVNLKDQVIYFAALGNNSLEVADSFLY